MNGPIKPWTLMFVVVVVVVWSLQLVLEDARTLQLEHWGTVANRCEYTAKSFVLLGRRSPRESRGTLRREA